MKKSRKKKMKKTYILSPNNHLKEIENKVMQQLKIQKLIIKISQKNKNKNKDRLKIMKMKMNRKDKI